MKTPKLLIIEDHTLTTLLYKTSFEKYYADQIILVFAATPEQAVTIYEQNPDITCIISDRSAGSGTTFEDALATICQTYSGTVIGASSEPENNDQIMSITHQANDRRNNQGAIQPNIIYINGGTQKQISVLPVLINEGYLISSPQ